MPIVGDIKNLYSDVEKTRALFPTTKVEAVSDEDGTGLNVILENMVYTGNAVEDSEVIPVNADTLGGRLAEEYATQNYVATKIAEAQLGGDGGDIDLSGYATKDEVSYHANDKNNPHEVTIAQIGAAPAGYVTYTGWFNSEDMLDSKLTEAYAGIADNKIGFAELESTSNAITLTQGKWFFTMYRSSAEYGVVTAIRYDSANVVAIMQRSLIGGTWGAWQNGSPSAFAPSGYGLGDVAQRIDNWNNAKSNGFYVSSYGCPDGDGNEWHGIVCNYNTALCNQLLWKSWTTGSVMASRRIIEGVAEPWEYVNPPMALGVEYRTTKRHNGKAVYTTKFNGGALPNNKTKYFTPTLTFVDIVDVIAVATCQGGGFKLPNIHGVTASESVEFWSGGNGTATKTYMDRSDYNLYVTFEYTKD